jgi:hypothetical protein
VKISEQELNRIYQQIAGKNPTRADISEQQQRELIAGTFKAMIERTEPAVMMSMTVVALAFMCDQFGVKREVVSQALLTTTQPGVLVSNGG